MSAEVINYSEADFPASGKVLVLKTDYHLDYDKAIHERLLKNGCTVFVCENDIEEIAPSAYTDFDYIIDNTRACFRKEFTPVACSFCGSDTKPLRDCGVYGYYNTCGACHSLILADYQFEGTEYDEDYVDRLGGEVLHHGYGVQAGDMFKHIDLPETGKFLEVGFSNPIILMGLARRGWDVHGLDMVVTKESRKRIKELDGKWFEGDIATFDIKDKYDVIWMSHVVEHLTDPLGTVKKLYDALAPGGYLCLCAPDPECLWEDKAYKALAHCHPDQHFNMAPVNVYSDYIKTLGGETVWFERDDADKLRYIHMWEWRLIARKGE